MFSLPELPYAYDALAPYMSAETLEFHHDKHHLAYVNNGNNLLKGSEWEGQSLENVVKGSFGKNAGLFTGPSEAMTAAGTGPKRFSFPFIESILCCNALLPIDRLNGYLSLELYFADSKPVPPSAAGRDLATAKRLWVVTAGMCGIDKINDDQVHGHAHTH